jgi:hypothetical protein
MINQAMRRVKTGFGPEIGSVPEDLQLARRRATNVDKPVIVRNNIGC